jgi:hypothetical protein
MRKPRNITPETRAKWRAAILANKPWRFSTGPKTAEGKAQVVRNGKKRQHGEFSCRELAALAREARALLREIETEGKKLDRALRRDAVERRGPSTENTKDAA